MTGWIAARKLSGMYRESRRPGNDFESVSGRLARLDAALKDVRRQTAKMVAANRRMAESALQACRRKARASDRPKPGN